MIDNDLKDRTLEGILALQIHVGPPMLVEFKDIRVKHLPDHFGMAERPFNGLDLNNWTLSRETLKDTWSVRDGLMINKGKPRGYIRTKADFTNYILRLQFRHKGKGNGGVLLRAVGPDKVGPGKVWPRSIEAQGYFAYKFLDDFAVFVTLDGFELTDIDYSTAAAFMIQEPDLALIVLDLGLVAGDSPVSKVLAAVLDAGVAVPDAEFDLEDKILKLTAPPNTKGIATSRVLLGSLAPDGAVLNGPEPRITVPSCEVPAVENTHETGFFFFRRELIIRRPTPGST